MLPTITTPAGSATAFTAEQVAITSDEIVNPLELNPFSYLAADTTDTLHYGQMLRDPDRSKFETAGVNFWHIYHCMISKIKMLRKIEEVKRRFVRRRFVERKRGLK
jgi:hypothetical protein